MMYFENTLLVRIRRASRLPVGKTWDTFEHDRVPVALRQQLDELADGSFVERGVKAKATIWRTRPGMVVVEESAG